MIYNKPRPPYQIDFGVFYNFSTIFIRPLESEVPSLHQPEVYSGIYDPIDDNIRVKIHRKVSKHIG